LAAGSLANIGLIYMLRYLNRVPGAGGGLLPDFLLGYTSRVYPFPG